jgi:23S rRNA (cytidine1920-2'-O)/16S rRNA (cytidine1409-2'-O)-methyltransferase
MTRQRADRLLVARGLVESRARAQALIDAGLVESEGRIIAKSSEMLGDDVPLELKGPGNPFVSRAALKLLHALDHFGLSPQGRIALDLGASTGGFTEVLLGRGAARVYAVDVGRGQLHARVKADPRVVSLERTDARALGRALIPEAPGFITADLSFIGLHKALPAALALAAPGAMLIALVKPQFEVGPEGVGKGGIVRDPALHAASVGAASAWLSAQPGWHDLGSTQSPIEGGDGNVEFLIAAKREA